MEAQIRGYTDPRTGEYKRATEANQDEVLEVWGFINAWKFYWEGPIDAETRKPVSTREKWLEAPIRSQWFDALSEEQRAMLADTPPPEEVPALVPSEESHG